MSDTAVKPTFSQVCYPGNETDLCREVDLYPPNVSIKEHPKPNQTSHMYRKHTPVLYTSGILLKAVEKRENQKYGQKNRRIHVWTDKKVVLKITTEYKVGVWVLSKISAD